jgi:hypothetical protein
MAIKLYISNETSLTRSKLIRRLNLLISYEDGRLSKFSRTLDPILRIEDEPISWRDQVELGKGKGWDLDWWEKGHRESSGFWIHIDTWEN